ncbi:MAG: multidrug efflux SMR transporter [Trueperaceae bacterium]|nr:multidrug efflux SMR transporter [Trueperaceae bacterium]
MAPLSLAYVWLLLSIALEVFATSMLQASQQFTRPVASIATVLGYVGAFYLLSLALRAVPLAVAYAIWAGLGIVLVTLVGVVVYRQALDAPALIGIALIVAGVLVVNLFSGAATH